MDTSPKLMAAQDLADYLGITRNAAYTLLHNETFPTVRIGERYFALREEVDVWIMRQAKEGGYAYGETSTR